MARKFTYLSVLPLLFAFTLLSGISAAPAAAGVTELKKGTIFKLRYELEVSGNNNFVMLGEDGTHDFYNSLYQNINSREGRFLTFDAYQGYFLESYQKTYRDCLERHRTYTSVPGSASSGNTVLFNNSSGNNVIINNSAPSSYDVYSSIGNNNCMRPNVTYSALVIDTNRADGGGIFREGYEFKVKRVKTLRLGDGFNQISVLFDHKVARGIVIITTRPVSEITIGQLSYNEDSGDGGFWDSLGQGLSNLGNIVGNNFTVLPAGPRYYD